MAQMFPELPDWLFETDEVSAGVYRVFGHDGAGRNVEAFGIDPEVLIQKCRQAALELMQRRRDATISSGRYTKKKGQI